MRLSEIYTSIQGEGPNTGKPTTFVRFGGCNLRCPGWGKGQLPDGTWVDGCDTVFAVYPEWRGSWESVDPDTLFERIPLEPLRVCLTGGEPLLQRTRDMNRLAFGLLDAEYQIDLFTNGSQSLHPYGWTQQEPTTVVMDWKLPGSGEFGSFNTDNLQYLREKDALKFVCKDGNDFGFALDILDTIVHRRTNAQIWFGTVWGELDHKTLAGWIEREYPNGRMNIQTHKLIWPPEARRV